MSKAQYLADREKKLEVRARPAFFGQEGIFYDEPWDEFCQAHPGTVMVARTMECGTIEVYTCYRWHNGEFQRYAAWAPPAIPWHSDHSTAPAAMPDWVRAALLYLGVLSPA